ncbi:unnamed protein product [Medioppia subpectinata]|uniref:RING-type E3 ubiquitin transferase n=1 Tax=Medioppia subpectinata TaxID=1979941 RepID=A0A7R9L5I9_9ACAR|nr:unnamed protein product [Medioppia subpectinata]CAG2115765.1 unnamed protein product [Medioppia subpectinata]
MSSALMATVGQLLRSGQRDDEYVSQLSQELNQLIQNWFGIRQWLVVRPHLPQLSQIIYYSVTTLSGLQTLGEEYVNIVQIDGNRLVVPKLLKRFTALMLQTYSPYLLSTENRRNYFYLSKRVTDIRYVSLNRSIGATDGSTNRLRSVYKVVGYLTLSQLLISFLVRFYSSQNSCGESSDDTFESSDCQTSVKTIEPEVTASDKCCLCLEKRRQTTATTCGHLFCWKCITEWLRLKTECPLCRQPLQTASVWRRDVRQRPPLVDTCSAGSASLNGFALRPSVRSVDNPYRHID